LLVSVEQVEDLQQVRWRVIPGLVLVFRELDSQPVAFNCLSGSTHLLSGSGHALLMELLERPGQECTASDFLEDSLDAGLAPQLLRCLAQLEHLGLIERVPQ
jgi:hypothetical protein